MPQVALAYYDYANDYECTGKWFHCGADSINRVATGQQANRGELGSGCDGMAVGKWESGKVGKWER